MQQTKNTKGHYINDARNSKYSTNARFAADYSTNTCSKTGFKWVRIFATKDIKAGQEIFLDYGEDFWEGIKTDPCQAHSANNVTGKVSKELWVIPAPQNPSLTTPGLSTPTSSKQHHRSPASPKLFNITPPPSLTSLTLSPIKSPHTPSSKTTLNDSLMRNNKTLFTLPLTILNETYVFQF